MSSANAKKIDKYSPECGINFDNAGTCDRGQIPRNDR